MDTKRLFKDGCLNLPSNMGKGVWLSLGKTLADTKKNHQWHIGDWMLFGTGKFRISVAAIAKSVGITVSTLKQYRATAQAFSLSMRVRNVPWSQHRAVVSVSDPEERLRLLRKAKREKMGIYELRCYLSGKRRPEEYKIVLVWSKPPGAEAIGEIHEIVSRTSGKVKRAGYTWKTGYPRKEQ